MIFKKLILSITVLFFALPHEQNSDGLRLLDKMHKRYESKWYKTLTFDQQTIRYDEEGKIVSENVWYEAIQMPDKLAIKFDDMDKGNGMIFRNDSIYQLKEGQVSSSRIMYHPLLILGFSVYDQPAVKTARALTILGFDLEKAHQRDYNGKKVYVVGALEGDNDSNQFWIDKETLLFVRMTQNFGNGRNQDVHFNKYEKIGGGWVATEVKFYTDNKLRLSEVYTNIKSPDELSPKIFEPASFEGVKWVP
ncbi:hypothetical protein [Roseivirga echinicomitans]|uniref:Outer membrane lipoprotein-sorting protein n=1 Tax=Roseivirga echinicomitans TaxID=296218 RepID=A0A150XY64_9BACT|nr:hypothetical protein [Roseivirga echinicomitans]KYG83707.1 hypothetical protein AWN68_02555 [Roseivirga echinicomitans]